MTAHTVIVGGGLAGLAAAVELSARGLPITLLEAQPRLGGRAGSFLDQATSETIDNCQHVAMGCCTNFLHFCRSIGAGHLLREQRELYFVGRDNRVNCLREGWLPAPLHLLSAFRRLSYLSSADLTFVRRAFLALARSRPERLQGECFGAWLEEHAQTPAAIERFWNVVLVSALSESLDRIDAAIARKVFVDGFLANRGGWRVWIPTVPLEALYGNRLLHWLEERGAAVQLTCGAQRVLFEQDRAVAVELRDGERIAGDQFVIAVPHHRVRSLFPDAVATHSLLSGLARLESAPISSVHLWFDQPITDLPHAVLVDRLSQWLFNRSCQRSEARSQESEDHYFQIVISASRDLAGRRQDDVIAEVLRELAEIWPAAAEAKLLRGRLVTEHRAVFSPLPGSDALRPPQQSPIANLQLAGDWTATGWPATMEGAVRSGYLAAENVLRHLGRPERLVRPDLPTSWVSRVLLNL